MSNTGAGEGAGVGGGVGDGPGLGMGEGSGEGVGFGVVLPVVDCPAELLACGAPGFAGVPQPIAAAHTATINSVETIRIAALQRKDSSRTTPDLAGGVIAGRRLESTCEV